MARGSGRPRYRVLPLAWRRWERIDDPHLLTEVVDAMEALPEWMLEISREPRPPVVVHRVRGNVLGGRYEVRGVRYADGRWLEVWGVRLVDAEQGAV